MSLRHGPVEQRAVSALAERRMMLATVESCTGGLISNRITDIAGASQVFWGAWCVYDNSAKTRLGVPAGLLERHGAVSAEVAASLAEMGLQAVEGALRGRPPGGAIVLATTGIAGPTGGSPEKPVGLCQLGLAATGRVGGAQTREVRGPAGLSRSEYKAYFSEQALGLLLEFLDSRG